MKKIYLASPFFNEITRENVEYVAQILRLRYDVFVPMEHKIVNAEKISNQAWGRLVFNMDVDAIDQCDIMVVLYYGMDSDSGTSWEQGYAYAKGKDIVVVNMDNFQIVNVMNYNGSDAVICKDELFDEDEAEAIMMFEDCLKVKPRLKTEQK